MGLDVFGCLLFCISADLADDQNSFGTRVILEHLEQIDVVRSVDWVSTNTDGCTLSESDPAELPCSFVGQGPALADDTDRSWLMDITWHDADLGDAWRDHPWAVWADQA